MENFTNETLDISQLPQFETVAMQSLEPDYWKVIGISWIGFFTVAIVAFALAYFNIDEFPANAIPLGGISLIVLLLVLLFVRLSFRKKAYAFREHDVLYKHGVIATTTIIIPYNRVQHVALYEGFIARMFGLATVEVYTAGASSSDIAIPGIKKNEAENIKQLLMGKIQKNL